MKTTPQEEWAGNHQSSSISLLSPVLLLLKTPVTSGSKPTLKAYFWVNPFLIRVTILTAYAFYQLHTLACMPMCINGVIDHTVVNFTTGLMDILMELGFGQAPPQDRWRSCGAMLTGLANALGESTSPSWVNPPTRGQHAELQLLVDTKTLFAMDGDSEDEEGPSLSVPLNLASTNQFSPPSSSLAGPSTLTREIAPHHQVAATVDGASPQGLPVSDVGAAAEIHRLQRELKRTCRSLKLARGMLTPLLFIH